MAGFDFLKATQKGMLGLKKQLDKSDHAWFTTLLATGVDKRAKSKAKHKMLSADEIYELACYFRVVQELEKASTKAHVMRPGGKRLFRFAYSPGRKENFAFFRFETSEGILDCLLGVEIPVPVTEGKPAEPSEAADIAIEKMSSLSDKNSDHGVLLAIWECKYHITKNKLSKNEFNQMIARLDIFGPKKPVAGDFFEGLGLPEPFQCCAILTTSKSTTFNMSRRFFYGFSIAFDYDLQKCGSFEPTRAQHLSNNS